LEDKSLNLFTAQKNIMGLFDFFTETIGLDPGSQNLRIIKNEEVIYNEVAIISVNKADGLVSGIGNSIKILPDHSIIKPVNYAICDFQAFEEMLKGSISKSMYSGGIWRPSLRIFSCVPSNASEVELRAYRDSAEYSGAKEVHVVHACFAAAIGMNILFEKKDFILIDFSASKIEITVFAESIPIAARTFRLGTWQINSLIKNFVNREYGIKLLDKELEKFIFALSEQYVNSNTQIHGKSILLKPLDDLLNHYFVLVNDTLLEAIEEAKLHINYNAIKTNGVYFTGGGSISNYLRNRINLGLDLKNQISNTPLLDCTNGIIEVMSKPAKYKDYTRY
jgi:rod shape-determining protein MreB